MGKRLRVLVVIFSLVIGYALYYVALPKLMNLEDFTPIISRYIKQEYGYNTKFEKPVFKMGYFPAIWMNAESFSIINTDKSDALRIKNPVIKISLLPLLIKKVNINYFSASDIFADIYCDDKLNLKIGEYYINLDKKIDARLQNSRVYVESYRFNLNDTVKKSKIVIDGKYFNIDRYAENKYLKTSFNFDIISKNKISPVVADIDMKLPFKEHLDDYKPEISVSVANFDFSQFANYIKYLTNGDITDASGILNIDIHSDKKINNQKQYLSTVLINNLYIKSKYFEKDYSFNGKIQLNSEYLLEGSILNVPLFDVIFNNTVIKLNGSVNKIDSKNPVPHLKLKINNAKAQDLIAILPYCKKLDDFIKINFSVIKDSDFFADINVDLDIKNNFKKPKLFGYIDIKNAYIERPIRKAPKNADINIKFIGNDVDLAVYVPTAKDQFVKVNGKIEPYNDNNADLHIISTPLIDLSEAERVLMPVHQAFNFLLGPVPIMKFSGFGEIDLVVKGTRKNPHAFGKLKTNNATVNFDDAPNIVLSNINAVLNFDDDNTDFHLLNGYVQGKKVSIDGKCNFHGKFDYDVKMYNQNAGYLVNAIKTSPMLSDFLDTVSILTSADGNADLNLNVSGQLQDISELDFGKNVHVKGNLILHTVAAKLINLSFPLRNISGNIAFSDFNIIIDLKSLLNASKINLKGSIKSGVADIKLVLDNVKLFDIAKILDNKFISINEISQNNASYAEINAQYNGKISKIDYSKLKASGKIVFKNCKLLYKPLKLPVIVSNGQVNIKNNDVFLNRLNTQIGTMPAVIGGKVSNAFHNPYFDISVFSRPNQKFLDYVHNTNSLYPIKAKGNIILSALLYGSIGKLNIKSNTHFDKFAKLYYMGATLGGDDLPIDLIINAECSKDRIFVKKLAYDKILESKSHIKQLTSSGYLIFGKKLFFNNFKIITYVPTDMKIFNILFKKPFIKKGNFTSDILINGPVNKPDIRGDLNLFNVDIPFLDSSIKSVSLKFLSSTIIASIIGETFENSFKLDMVALNNLNLPFVVQNAKIDAGKININSIYNSINSYSEHSENNISESNNFDLNNLIIKKLYIVAEEVIVNATSAHNLSANISLNSGNLTIDRFKFNLADGKMDGYLNYNFKSKNSKFDAVAENIDANMLANVLAGLDGQIYGNLNGQMNVTCHGDNQNDCFKSLFGHIAFKVKDGKMPKLGSLEYLLKAGNLVKSGITGLSVNNIINLVAPLKTGTFSEIKGSIDINKGVADKIQIISDSKDLNLFIIGEYDIVSKYADMYVFGRLSRKISTILGPVGNLSLNTLFNTIPGVNLNNTSDKGLLNNINKIPGLELTNKLYRVFAAEIHGDISGDDYVDSFRWIE